MESLHECMSEYKKQLQKGMIQKAYKGLMETMMGLRTHLKNKHPDYFVSGSLYHGFMDMSYFSFFPESLKKLNLKIAIVFLHEAGRFEAWLSGYNKQVQAKYWKLFKESDWKKYPVVTTIKGADSIIEHILVGDPDFSDPDKLTRQIETGTLKFIKELEGFIATKE